MIYPTNFILSVLDMILKEFDHESVKRQEVLLSSPVSPDAFLLIEFSVETLGISTKLVLWGMSHLVLIEVFQSKLWEFWLKTWIMRKMQSHSFQLKFCEFRQILNHEARHTLHSFQSKLWEFGWVPARDRHFTLCALCLLDTDTAQPLWIEKSQVQEHLDEKRRGKGSIWISEIR